MKFDCIIMNPPYQRGLYTDIFAQAETHLNDDGVCICLSPINRYVNQIKKGKTELSSKHNIKVEIDDVNLIAEEDAKKIFNIALSEDLAIFVYKNSINKTKCDLTKMISDYDLYSLMKHKVIMPFNKKYEKIPKGFSLRYGVGCGSNSGTKYGFGCVNYENACKQHITGHLAFINLSTENERFNCWKSGWTDFIRFCAKVDDDIVPFMENAIHPRTGLKGYASEWSNDDFFEYFKIPQTLKDKILKFMRPHHRIYVNGEFVLKE